MPPPPPLLLLLLLLLPMLLRWPAALPINQRCTLWIQHMIANAVQGAYFQSSSRHIITATCGLSEG